MEEIVEHRKVLSEKKENSPSFIFKIIIFISIKEFFEVMMALWFASLFMFFGRICLGAIFVWSAFDKVVNYSQYLGLLEAQRVDHPVYFMIGALVLEFFGGLSLMFGVWARLFALLLFVYMFPATFIFHNFWSFGAGDEKHLQTILFLKNVAIAAGLLYVLACGAGKFSYGSSKKSSDPEQ